VLLKAQPDSSIPPFLRPIVPSFLYSSIPPFLHCSLFRSQSRLPTMSDIAPLHFDTSGNSLTTPGGYYDRNAGLACPLEKEADIRGHPPPCGGCAKLQMTRVRDHVRDKHMPGLRFHQRCGGYFPSLAEYMAHESVCRTNRRRHRNEEATEQAWMELYDFVVNQRTMRPVSPCKQLPCSYAGGQDASKVEFLLGLVHVIAH
jgi:hypothetical protein